MKIDTRVRVDKVRMNLEVPSSSNEHSDLPEIQVLAMNKKHKR